MLTMDWQSVVNIGTIAILGVIGYLYKELVSDQKHDRQLINDLRVDLPTEYVSKADLTAQLVRIETHLSRIEDLLGMKADKT